MTKEEFDRYQAKVHGWGYEDGKFIKGNQNAPLSPEERKARRKAKHIAKLKAWVQRRGWVHWSGDTVFQKRGRDMVFGRNQLQIFTWGWRSRKRAERSGKPFGPYKRLIKWAFYAQLEISPKGKLRGLQDAEE